MNSKPVLVLSLALNVILAAWIVRSPGPRPVPSIGAPEVVVLPEPSRAAGQRSATAAGSLDPEVNARPETFGWRQVESGDYRQYLANLRAVGCPEKTIRDIVVADVNDLFVSRAAAITQTNLYRYWRNDPLRRTEEQERQLRELWAQKRDVLRTLGFDAPDLTGLMADTMHDAMLERDRRIEFLPEPKRQEVKDTIFRAAQQSLIEGNSVAQNDAIELEVLSKIQSLLTPEEFHEYELRSSTDAQRLSGTLDSLELTEQEFRAIFDSWRSLKALGVGTPERWEVQQSSETALKRMLGPERFLRYLDGVRQWGYPE